MEEEEGSEEQDVPPLILPELFLTPDQMEEAWKEPAHNEPLLSSFLVTPDDFSNLVSSIARQLGRVLKFIKPSPNLVVSLDFILRK